MLGGVGLDGEYTVILTVEGGRGAEGSDTVVIEVLNPSPLARFTFRPVEPVVFDALASYDPAALGPKEVVSWHWDLGDGIKDESQLVEHVTVPGEYTVALTVTDDDGAEGSSGEEQVVGKTGSKCSWLLRLASCRRGG